MKWLIFDTDILIDILRGERSAALLVSALMKEYHHPPACSCITVGEIFSGMRPKEEELTRTLLNSLAKIPVTEEIAEYAGKLKQKTKSHTLWLDDCIIAATAILNDGLLITKNVKHYPFRELSLKTIKQ